MIAILLLLTVVQARAEEWRYYGGDSGGMKYSSLRQIDRGNVGKLGIAWEFDTGEIGDGKTEYPSRTAFECTPVVIDGVMYISTPFHRLIAIDPETGTELWSFDPKFDRGTRVHLYVNRGVSYWANGKTKRIFLGDQEGRLFSIDPGTQKPDPRFGDNGMIDLRRGVADRFPDTRYGLTSPAAVCRDVVVAGSWTGDSEPKGPGGEVRAFDVRDGRLRWTFHTVPRPGEYGNASWKGDSWKDRGGANVWSVMSVDEKLGTIFLPVTSPAYDFYGGDRKGANLFGDSLVALDCGTGERKWHFQTIHHNLWDWDLPAQPALIEVMRGGSRVPAVAQITKTGFVFLFNRLSGAPLFPIEERAVPQSEIPGEASSPTQPFPVRPPPFARQSMSKDEITMVTPESRRECLEMIQNAVVDAPMFRPIGEKLTVMFPGTNGGANWGGGSFDPESGTLYVNSMDVGALFQMVKRPAGSAVSYRVRGTKYGRFWDSNEYPCQQPPWGTLTAIDLKKGEFRWRAVLGEFEELSRRGVPKTGTPNLGGSIVTAGGLVFIAATNDSKFRAFDKDTGQELWVALLPASGHATPMTYLGEKSGRQFVVIAAGGGNDYSHTYSGKLIAFALEDGSKTKSLARVQMRSESTPVTAYKSKEEELPGVVRAQPIPFSHKKHSVIGLNCRDCHGGALTQEKAGLPGTGKCMTCHRTLVTDNDAIRRLSAMHARKEEIEWVRVYQAPDFVFFSHATHSKAGVDCSACHGPVHEREVLAKEVPTSMTACMNCHAVKRAANGCNVCHELGR